MTTALLIGQQRASAAPPHSAPRTLATKDFASELPEKLRDARTRPQTLSISIAEQARVEILVHYDALVDEPDFFRKIEIEVTECPRDVEVQAVVGQILNLGTARAPLMAVPFLLQWSSLGWLRTEKWTIFANGQLVKGESSPPP